MAFAIFNAKGYIGSIKRSIKKNGEEYLLLTLGASNRASNTSWYRIQVFNPDLINRIDRFLEVGMEATIIGTIENRDYQGTRAQYIVAEKIDITFPAKLNDKIFDRIQSIIQESIYSTKDFKDISHERLEYICENLVKKLKSTIFNEGVKKSKEVNNHEDKYSNELENMSYDESDEDIYGYITNNQDRD